eukprot:TRINITY_DN5005_c0_g1_i2.p3 TRINITY_DN5005_c0_g1~~TRINITY_DN5005_c0_g1_i2.p3  ORF type:complete len:142 (-),score=33.18 TRINITY_DN5005_c0_g1_i2:508-933(-)
MTYYEYFEFFFKMLYLFQDLIRLERISSASDQLLNSKVKADISNYVSTSRCAGNMESMLASLYGTQMGNKQTQITVPYISTPQTHSLAKSQNLHKDTASFLCPLLFSSLDLDSFFEILCNVYLEHSIIFVSSNLNVLTSSM